jgi:RNA polymerase-binding transcription factor DksA
MTELQRDELRGDVIDRLLRIYQMVRPDVTHDLIHAALRVDPSDEAEESAVDELRALDAQLGDRELHLAHALEDALRRLDGEHFGTCIDCGSPISFERLRAIPWTLRCADDERLAEPAMHHSTL